MSGSARAMEDATAIALEAVAQAGLAGAVSLSRNEAWSAKVRLGAIESIESSISRGLSVTVYGAGNRTAAASTCDLEPAGVRAAVAAAVEAVAFADPDAHGGLPPVGETGLAGGDLQLDDPAYATLDREALAARALAAEKAAFAVDPRVRNSDDSSAAAHRGESVFATTDGVRVRRAATTFSYGVGAVAEDNGEKQGGWWWTYGRHLGALQSPEVVGRIAGERAVRGFGWRKPASGPARVLLTNEMASDLLGILASAVSGGAVYRGTTWLAGSLGQVIAAPSITIVDDALIPREIGSRPCDGEAVRSRRVAVVEQGRLASFLVDAYAARRLKHPFTGHAGGASNLRLASGRATFADLLHELGTGLVVEQFNGWSVDLASGTFSRGVSGYWVEQGRRAHPIQEATIAGNLKDLLLGIRAVGDDPLPMHAVSSPSLLIDGFTVGGG